MKKMSIGPSIPKAETPLKGYTDYDGVIYVLIDEDFKFLGYRWAPYTLKKGWHMVKEIRGVDGGLYGLSKPPTYIFKEFGSDDEVCVSVTDLHNLQLTALNWYGRTPSLTATERLKQECDEVKKLTSAIKKKDDEKRD